jgi:endonuclease/exonuclease/phosphatase family metal-dependent hydrolase
MGVDFMQRERRRPPTRTPFLRALALTLALVAGCAGGRGVGAGQKAAAPPFAPPSPPAEPAGAMRVMSFNIRFGTAPDGDNAWPNRRALAFRAIRDFRPAVLGLQEVLRFQLDEIRREMPVYGEVGVGRDDGAQGGEYAAILYDRHRFELLREGHFWLSDGPEIPGSMSWGNRYPRIVTWARVRDRATSATFLVVNTHWDHESQVARENSARLMNRRLTPHPDDREPLLVMGDLNCSDDNPAFRLLVGGAGAQADVEPADRSELADTFTAMFPRGVAGSGTFHAFRGGRDGPRIDFVLVWPLGKAGRLQPPDGGGGKQWRVLQADIVHTSENGRYPSDHFPVTATLLLTDVEANVESP